MKDKRAQLAKELKIRPKTKQFIDLLDNDPKISQTSAWLATHETNSPKTASIEASRTLAKPSVQIYRAHAVNKAKKKIISLLDSDDENMVFKASESIIDRTYGKATQATTSVNAHFHQHLSDKKQSYNL